MLFGIEASTLHSPVPQVFKLRNAFVNKQTKKYQENNLQTNQNFLKKIYFWFIALATHWNGDWLKN